MSACTPFLTITPQSAAHAARGEWEAILDSTGWQWNCGISTTIDKLLVIEEGSCERMTRLS